MNALPPASSARLVAAPAVHASAGTVARLIPAGATEEGAGIRMGPVTLVLLAAGFMALGALIARFI